MKWLSVGLETSGKPTTVPDQGQSGGGTASVTCAVRPRGQGFDIQLSVTVPGADGGAVTIASPSGAGAVGPSGATGVAASFANAGGDTFTEADCTITYEYMGSPVPVSPPVASGRIWGHLACPHAVSAGGQTVTGAGGAPTAVSCAAGGDFLFENCSP